MYQNQLHEHIQVRDFVKVPSSVRYFENFRFVFLEDTEALSFFPFYGHVPASQ